MGDNPFERHIEVALIMKATDRHKLIERIKSVEGLTDHERSAILGLLHETKTYGLVWEDKPEEVEERLREELPILVEDKSKALTPGGINAPNHIIIEGDNLESLSTLAYTHSGKIDVIYIDPPYNTGNNDFVYNDDYVDSDDSYKHSKWLSFIKKRLIIAKKLLKETGVIFISIDDNEAANLKVLCDDSELFVAKNFAGHIIWHQGRKSIAAQFAINHEYCLVYCKDRTSLLSYDLEHENNNWREKKEGLDEIYKEFNRLSEEFGRDYTSIEKGMRKFYKNLPSDHPAKRSQHYSRVDSGGLYFADNISQGTGKGGRFNIIHPITKKPCKIPTGGWRFGESKLPGLLAADLIHFGTDENIVPCFKRYLRTTEYEVMSSVFYRDGRGATKRLEMLLGKNEFIITNYEDRQRRLERAKGAEGDLKKNIQILEKRIHRYDVQIQQEPDLKYDTLVKLKPFFEKVADSLLKKKKALIENEMQQQLNRLLVSYKGHIGRVELSESMENFNIKIFHTKGNQISLNQLNAA